MDGGAYTPSFSMHEYYTDSLCQMGFPKDVASNAVEMSDGRFEMALQFCLTGVAGRSKTGEW